MSPIILFLWRTLTNTCGNYVIYYLGQPNLDGRLKKQNFIIILIIK